MHELGLCDALLKMVRGVMKEESVEEVQRINFPAKSRKPIKFIDLRKK